MLQMFHDILHRVNDFHTRFATPLAHGPQTSLRDRVATLDAQIVKLQERVDKYTRAASFNPCPTMGFCLIMQL